MANQLLFTEEQLLDLGRQIWQEREHRWFHDHEIYLILTIPKTLGIPISDALSAAPKDKDAFLFYTNHDIKDDFYDWKRKGGNKHKDDQEEGEQGAAMLSGDGKEITKSRSHDKECERGKGTRKSLQESYTHMTISSGKTILAIYSKCESMEHFKRRIYKLDNKGEYYYQLTHYRNDSGDMIPQNKAKIIDPRIGYLVYTYLLQPELFIKDLPNPSLLGLITNHWPTTNPVTIEANNLETSPLLGKRHDRSPIPSIAASGKLSDMMPRSTSASSQHHLKRAAIEHDHLQIQTSAGIEVPSILPAGPSSSHSTINPVSPWNYPFTPRLSDCCFDDLSIFSYDRINLADQDGDLAWSNSDQFTLLTDEQLQTLSYKEMKEAQQGLEQYLFTTLVQRDIDKNRNHPVVFYHKDQYGYNLFHYCCQQSYGLPLMRQLVELVPELLTEPTSHGVPPLRLAINAGHQENIAFLLQHRHEDPEIAVDDIENQEVLSLVVQDLLQEPEQHDINIKYKETLAEKIEFAENFPHLLLPAELERLQQLKSTLTPQELEQLRKENTLTMQKQYYMMKMKYQHLRRLYFQLKRNATIRIDYLPDGCQLEQLLTLFSPFGCIMESYCHSLSEGTAHLVYMTETEAIQACNSLNGSEYYGKRLSVTIEGDNSQTNAAFLDQWVETNYEYEDEELIDTKRELHEIMTLNLNMASINSSTSDIF